MSDEIFSSDMPEINLAAQMKNLLSQHGTDFAVASQSETGSGDGKDLKVVSMLQLLQRLKSLLEATVNETNEEGSAEKVELLSSELRNLLGQDTQSLSETVEKLQGRLNPAVIKKEAELEGLAEKAVEANPENQNPSVQLAALLTVLNGLLPQTPKQSLDKNVETTKGPERIPLTVPEIQPEQQKAAATQDPETASLEDVQASEQVKKLVQRANSGNAESEKSGAPITPVSDQKATESSQPKSAKVSNLSARIHPALMQSPIVDEERGAQSDKPLEDSSIEVVITEEEPMLGVTDLSADMKGSTIAERRDLSKGENFQAISTEGKSSWWRIALLLKTVLIRSLANR